MLRVSPRRGKIEFGFVLLNDGDICSSKFSFESVSVRVFYVLLCMIIVGYELYIHNEHVESRPSQELQIRTQRTLKRSTMVRRSPSAKRNSNMSEEETVPLTKSESHEEEDIKDDDNEDEEEDDDDDDNTEDEEEPSARGHPPHMTPVPVKDEDEDNEDDEEPSAPNTPSSGRPPHMTPVPVHIQPYYAFYPYPGMLPSGFPTSTGEFYSDASGMMDPPPDPRRNRGGVTEPFPEKLHRCLDSCERDGLSDVFSFFSHGRAFAIHKPRRFVVEIMPRFFRQTKLTSFQRQLNLYGFKRVGQGPDNGGYYHELFLKGRPGLCVNMKRTKIKGNAKGKRDLEGEPNFYGRCRCSDALQ